MNNITDQRIHLLGWLLLLPCMSFGQEGLQEMLFPQAFFERTEIRTLHSDIVGEDYELFVSLPKTYHQKDTTYPVIYLLDAYRGFPVMKGCVELFTVPSLVIPEVILVGIGYGSTGEEALLRWSVGRTRDLTPVRNSGTEAGMRNNIARAGIPGVEVVTGGAPRFLSFLKEELIPFVESNYRIDSNARVLAGYSFGGLFAMYLLFHEPGLFDKYFIGSPSLNYGEDVAFTYESTYAREHSGLKAEVFMSSGELEKITAENIGKMSELLLSRNYAGFYLETYIFPRENHVSCYPAAIGRALIELFNNKK